MWFKGKRSRNKASVGEPADGSLNTLIRKSIYMLGIYTGHASYCYIYIFTIYIYNNNNNTYKTHRTTHTNNSHTCIVNYLIIIILLLYTNII